MRNRPFFLLAIHLFLRRVPGTLVSQTDVAARPHGTQESVPEGEERLAEVRLDAPALVMHVMVSGVVARQVLDGIEGEGVAAVVVDSFDGAESEEPHGLPH